MKKSIKEIIEDNKTSSIKILQEDLYTDGCIRTFSGHYVNILNPQPEHLVIEDIAHALSMLPRFGGHLPKFYSVANHCILCHDRDTENPYDSLMHDSSEAYLMDLPTPIKKLLPDYYKIEDNLMKVLSKKFGFNYPFNQSTKDVDKYALKKEWQHIMLGKSFYKSINYNNTKIQFISKFLLYDKHIR